MTDNALQFVLDGARDGPLRCRIDPGQLGALFEQATRPAVFVMRTKDLRKLLQSKSARGRIAPMKTQDSRSGLGRYFKGTKPVALNGKYTKASNLSTHVMNFLTKAKEAGDDNLYFLGALDEIFDELRSEAPESVLEYGERAPDIDSEPIRPNATATDPDIDWREAFTGGSPESQQVRELIEIAATAEEFAETPVLILGPSGAGKEVVANAIHGLDRGARGGSLVDVNCAAISKDLLETELFGIASDVATGVAARIGLWELASIKNGTLLLNEIGELTAEHQAKILRALQEGVIRRVGGRQNIRVSARIIADTNRELYQMVNRGEFRLDLFERLARLVIRVPGLAGRRSDIEDHAQRLWRAEVTRKPEARLSARIISILSAHSWPGGVRELRGLLETTYSLCYGNLSPGEEVLYEAWEARGDSPLAGASAPPLPAPAGSAEQPVASNAGARLDPAIVKFKNMRPGYERFARVLQRIMEGGAQQHAPLAIVQTRTKSVARVAEKLQRITREEGEEIDLVDALPDLCGGRMIVHTSAQADDLIAFFERYFEVVSREPLSSSAHPRSVNSGYPPTRLTVHLDRSRAEALASALGVEIPDEVLGLSAEIEIRTVLEHAWDIVNHDMGHDVPLPLPVRWSRELDELSRVLQAVDASFSRIRTCFQTYRTTYPAQLTPEQTQREIEILENVLAYEADPAVAVRLAKLAIGMEDWDRAIDTLQDHAAAGYQPAMRDLGVALCQRHRGEPYSAVYQRGQAFLTQAAAEPHRDPDALASLAGTLKRSGQEDRARECYARAHEIDPADPYALWGLLEMDLARSPNVDFVGAMQSDIDGAVERCQDQIAAGVNLPWALFDLGKFLLLRGETSESFIALARGIERSHASFMIQTTLESLDRIAGHDFAPAELSLARGFLALGCAAKFPSDQSRNQLQKRIPQQARILRPVVLVADRSGGNGSGDTKTPAGELTAGFEGFRGTVVSMSSDAPETGVSSLVASLGGAYPETIHTVAYTSSSPDDEHDARRYAETHQMDERDPNLRAMLQTWADLVMSDIAPGDVLVLCFGTLPEDRVLSFASIALGARVVSVTTSEDKGTHAGADACAAEFGETVPPTAGALHRLLDDR